MFDLMAKIRVYYREENNEIVAQNMICGMKGQEHRHTKEEWEIWKERSKDMVELIDLRKDQ